MARVRYILYYFPKISGEMIGYQTDATYIQGQYCGQKCK